MQSGVSLKKKPLRAKDLVIGGFTPLTTIDYPDQLSAVIFLQGCPWRCGYCQNADLLPRQSGQSLCWQSIIERLQKRRRLLDAVVFSGGEPTLQQALLPAIDEIKSMGFKVGLHSAGIYPHRLQQILPEIDWIGLDIKAALADYPDITGVEGSGERAWQSAQLVIQSGIDYEFRSTLHPDMLNPLQLSQLAQELCQIKAQHVVIQSCITSRCLDESLRGSPVQPLDLDWIQQIENFFDHFTLRQY